ncbi:hypothetical protein HanHA300_Chr07g0233161 [Helianthus annuus]|nr:hypothetical protein HanHA300_Chr07g0233161 [Helianthus annuus]KAJ0562354.1 hypothetical protein HanHA89_Chr07g0250341 [Helianthus annuus]
MKRKRKIVANLYFVFIYFRSLLLYFWETADLESGIHHLVLSFLESVMPPRKETTTIDDPLQALLEKFDQFLSTNATTVAESSAQAKAQFETLHATMNQQLEVSNKLLAAFIKDKETTSFEIGSSSYNPPPPPPGHQPPPLPPPPLGKNQPRPPKILLLIFDGSNPLD